MITTQGVYKELIEQSEWVAIATAGVDGPHLVATWGDYVRDLGIEEDKVLIPAGRFNKTEENLKRDNRVELLFASRKVQGTRGSGQGCCVSGTAALEYKGPAMDKVKARFPWARAALVITVRDVKAQL